MLTGQLKLKRWLNVGRESEIVVEFRAIDPASKYYQAAYFTLGPWKYVLTRSGESFNVCMYSAVAAFSFALGRAGE